MDDKISPDKNSPEYYWYHFAANQKVNDFLYRSTDHGPEWTENEIENAVVELINNIKKSLQQAKVMLRDQKLFKDFNPKKKKKKLLEYIKKYIDNP
jgi:hypothetical protein